MQHGNNGFVRSRSLVVAFAILTTTIVMLLPNTAVSAGNDSRGNASDDGTGEAVACYDAALSRQRTEVDADVSVAQFDPARGQLLEVSVSEQEINLDTDASFENVAQSAVVFGEHMTYNVTLTSPGALASPPSISGTIERVPSQTLAAFDGSVDFTGLSAVAQPLMSRSEHAAAITTTDQAILDAFTGTATVPFHIATQISETFMGGGGNVAAVINTYVAASIQVCYRYAKPAAVPRSPAALPSFTG